VLSRNCTSLAGYCPAGRQKQCRGNCNACASGRKHALDLQEAHFGCSECILRDSDHLSEAEKPQKGAGAVRAPGWQRAALGVRALPRLADWRPAHHLTSFQNHTHFHEPASLLIGWPKQAPVQRRAACSCRYALHNQQIGTLYNLEYHSMSTWTHSCRQANLRICSAHQPSNLRHEASAEADYRGTADRICRLRTQTAKID